MKIKDIKPTVEKKVAKGKVKVAAKCCGKCAKCCGKCAKCAKTASLLLSACCLSLILAGCSTADAPTAQRAQTVTAQDITINVNLIGGPTNAAPSVSIEIATAAQANETAGTETMTSTPTLTPTNDVRPTTTVNYGLTSSSAGGSDWISDLTSASAKGLASWLKSGSANGTMTVTKTDGTTETVTCKDGTCTTASGECVTCSE